MNYKTIKLISYLDARKLFEDDQFMDCACYDSRTIILPGEIGSAYGRRLIILSKENQEELLQKKIITKEDINKFLVEQL